MPKTPPHNKKGRVTFWSVKHAQHRMRVSHRQLPRLASRNKTSTKSIQLLTRDGGTLRTMQTSRQIFRPDVHPTRRRNPEGKAPTRWTCVVALMALQERAPARARLVISRCPPRSRISSLTAQLLSPAEKAQYFRRVRVASEVLRRTHFRGETYCPNVLVSEAGRQEKSPIIRGSAFKIIRIQLERRGERVTPISPARYLHQGTYRATTNTILRGRRGASFPRPGFT